MCIQKILQTQTQLSLTREFASLTAVTEKVGFLVGSAGFMVEREMIFCEFGDPMSLSLVQLLGLSEILEVLMISPDFKVLGSSHEVVSPFTEC